VSFNFAQDELTFPSTSHLVLSEVEGHGPKARRSSEIIHGIDGRIGGAIAATTAYAYIPGNRP
jgi:hypothetical protein